jgi:hypothetical protein
MHRDVESGFLEDYGALLAVRFYLGADSHTLPEQEDLFIVFGMLYRPTKMYLSLYITLDFSTRRNELVCNGAMTSKDLLLKLCARARTHTHTHTHH